MKNYRAFGKIYWSDRTETQRKRSDSRIVNRNDADTPYFSWSISVCNSGEPASIILAGFPAKNRSLHELTAAIISTGAFLCMMPQSVEGKDGAIGALLSSYLGSNGIFVAIVTALCISSLYIWLVKKNLSLKLPDSVPPMVSQSLSPTFVSIIIFTIVLIVKHLFTLTSYGNIYDFISEVISAPVMHFGSSPWA